MKKTLVISIILVISITLVGCGKDKKYPIAEQSCIDNGGKVTVDEEGKDICLLGENLIYLADMEMDNKQKKISLNNEELDEIAKNNFPKSYTFSKFYVNENLIGDEGSFTYPEGSSYTSLIPEHTTMISREIISSGIQDGMIYTDTKVTLQDNTTTDILYIVNPSTLKFVAISVKDENSTTNYQFSY